MGIFTVEELSSEFKGVKNVAIAGHIRPDGDCISSSLALQNYLKQLKPELKLERIDVYLEPIDNDFRFLQGADEIHHTCDEDFIYDLFISLDCGSLDRLGQAQKYFQTAKRKMNIDHHISNTKFADINYVIDDASSTCEVLYYLFDENYITQEIAEALYVGIIHDTGVFKHSNTKEKTMNAAGRLISKGINFSKLIDETFYQKTYMQNQLLGRCLMESILLLDGKVIFSSADKNLLKIYEAKSSDLDGVIDQLRVTKGVEVAIFIYETDNQEYKVSLRSNGDINVSKIAVFFGGGGHIKAAGCTMKGTQGEIIKQLLAHIEEQLRNK